MTSRLIGLCVLAGVVLAIVVVLVLVLLGGPTAPCGEAPCL